MTTPSNNTITKQGRLNLNIYLSGLEAVVYYFFSLMFHLRLWPASSEDWLLCCCLESTGSSLFTSLYICAVMSSPAWWLVSDWLCGRCPVVGMPLFPLSEWLNSYLYKLNRVDLCMWITYYPNPNILERRELFYGKLLLIKDKYEKEASAFVRALWNLETRTKELLETLGWTLQKNQP